MVIKLYVRKIFAGLTTNAICGSQHSCSVINSVKLEDVIFSTESVLSANKMTEIY